jgi:hypothetical protein
VTADKAVRVCKIIHLLYKARNRVSGERMADHTNAG